MRDMPALRIRADRTIRDAVAGFEAKWGVPLTTRSISDRVRDGDLNWWLEDDGVRIAIVMQRPQLPRETPKAQGRYTVYRATFQEKSLERTVATLTAKAGLPIVRHRLREAVISAQGLARGVEPRWAFDIHALALAAFRQDVTEGNWNRLTSGLTTQYQSGGSYRLDRDHIRTDWRMLLHKGGPRVALTTGKGRHEVLIADLQIPETVLQSAKAGMDFSDLLALPDVGRLPRMRITGISRKQSSKIMNNAPHLVVGVEDVRVPIASAPHGVPTPWFTDPELSGH